MNTTEIVVTLGGLALSAFIAWFFWFAPRPQTRGVAGAGDAQEVAITVKGGYAPDVIVVQAGRPVRLRFTRQESSTCSEMALFPEFGRNARLPQGRKVAVEFTPGGRLLTKFVRMDFCRLTSSSHLPVRR